MKAYNVVPILFTLSFNLFVYQTFYCLSLNGINYPLTVLLLLKQNLITTLHVPCNDLHEKLAVH